MGKPSAAVAANRFGLGARPGDLDVLRQPRDWVLGQLVPARAIPKGLADLPAGAELVRRVAQARRDADAVRQVARTQYRVEAMARTVVMVETEHPVRERLVRFWSNHFTVSALKGGPVPGLVGAYEREAIRPYAMGHFVDLLTAVVHHPAMLLYLDQARSVGPGSRAGQRRPERGLNENLARELLELHTLGVDGGYSQDDVEALARVLTGLSVDRETGGYDFVAARHEPGAKDLLGRSWEGGGEVEVTRVLAHLAMHPSTIRHVCTKLARHFVDDDPPTAVVDAMATAWRVHGGHLGRVVAALVEHDEAWGSQARKIKSPEELVISAARGLTKDHDPEGLLQSLKMLGQEPWMAPSPAGWGDTGATWTGADAVLRRVQWAEKVADVVQVPRPARRAEALLGELLSPRTRAALDGPDAVALLLACPEFQRR